MSTWRPREAPIESPLVDGIPEYLVESLIDWVNEAERVINVGIDAYNKPSYRRKPFLETFDLLCRRHTGITNSTTAAFFINHWNEDPDLLLDYIDYVLSELGKRATENVTNIFSPQRGHGAVAVSGTFQSSAEQINASRDMTIEALDKLLVKAGSKWRVGKRDGNAGLVERVDPTMDEAADKAMSECGDAGELLAEAWRQLFGRSPNPTEAYNTVMRALDETTKHTLSPNNPQATLGQSLTNMRNQHWQYAIEAKEKDNLKPGEKSHNVDGGVIQLMLRTIMENHDTRHAAGEITSEQARSAIFLAVPIIQAFHDGLVSKPE
ncbi:MAG: hypothetical protein ABF747_07855 [Bifidobacterium sp.]|uniref:TIGR02391 family protein n=1 Tax=Bifidobacterium fermentum TaxID=3059035 RepID=A0AB39UJA9_9BIFI